MSKRQRIKIIIEWNWTEVKYGISQKNCTNTAPLADTLNQVVSSHEERGRTGTCYDQADGSDMFLGCQIPGYLSILLSGLYLSSKDLERTSWIVYWRTLQYPLECPKLYLRRWKSWPNNETQPKCHVNLILFEVILFQSDGKRWFTEISFQLIKAKAIYF